MKFWRTLVQRSPNMARSRHNCGQIVSKVAQIFYETNGVGSVCSSGKLEKSTVIQVNLANKCPRFQCSYRPPRARRYLRNLRFRESRSRPVYSLSGAWGSVARGEMKGTVGQADQWHTVNRCKENRLPTAGPFSLWFEGLLRGKVSRDETVIDYVFSSPLGEPMVPPSWPAQVGEVSALWVEENVVGCWGTGFWFMPGC